MNYALYPGLETLPPLVKIHSRYREKQYEKLEQLEAELTDLSINVNWPDEELSQEQEDAMRERMKEIRDEIKEIEEELGL